MKVNSLSSFLLISYLSINDMRLFIASKSFSKYESIPYWIGLGNCFEIRFIWMQIINVFVSESPTVLDIYTYLYMSRKNFDNEASVREYSKQSQVFNKSYLSINSSLIFFNMSHQKIISLCINLCSLHSGRL